VLPDALVARGGAEAPEADAASTADSLGAGAELSEPYIGAEAASVLAGAEGAAEPDAASVSVSEGELESGEELSEPYAEGDEASGVVGVPDAASVSVSEGGAELSPEDWPLP